MRNHHAACPGRPQEGASLVELLVGITVGLLVILVGIGTLVVSRATSATVSDISQLQQQGSYAMRVIGLQLRQGGSLELTPLPGNSTYTLSDFAGTTVSGIEGGPLTTDKLVIGNQASLTLDAGKKDCLGDGPKSGADQTVIMSTFAVNANQELTCVGVGNGSAQPLISNVADFQVVYRVNTGTSAAPVLARLKADAMTPAHWKRVTAIEVCLDLQGTETTPDGGTTYLDCKGAHPPRGNRVHLVYRNVFSLRRQGMQEAPL